MSTSLARQLEQLRTSAQVSSQLSRDGGASLAALGPNILETQLGGEQLTLLAKEAIQELSMVCPILEKFQPAIFRDDPDDVVPDDEGDVAMEDGAFENVEDVLYLLTPYMLKRPAQCLLQYLLTKHKVHVKHPEALFFSTLPYYEYAIFNRIVEALPIRPGKAHAEEEFPRWVEHFKHACHPATTIGLNRHVASDPGFFKLICHVFVQKLLRSHVPRFMNEQGVTYDKIVHLFTTAMVNGLNLCGSIGEHQTYNLMQVILAGLKLNAHQEFRSAAIILFACLVPRISMKAKVANKLLKSIGKISIKTTETLSMVALLFRCQKSVVDQERVLVEILSHEDVLQTTVFANIEKQPDEDQEFARRLLKMVALLCDSVLDIVSRAETAHLLSITLACLSSCKPSNDTAEILISCVSKCLVQYKAEKRKKTKSATDDEVSLSRKRSISACKKILDLLKKSFVEEYARRSVIRHESDILFVEGQEMPTQDQIAVKRLLIDNEFIIEMANGTIMDTFPTKEVLKANSNSVKSVLRDASADFLLSQLSAKGLTSLCVNVLNAYAHKAGVLEHGLALITSEVFLKTEDIQDYLGDLNIDLELLLLPHLFIYSEKHREGVLAAAERYSKSAPKGLIVTLMPTLRVANSDGEKPMKLFKRLYERLLTSFDTAKVGAFIMDAKTHQQPEMLTLMLLVISHKLTKKPSADGVVMLIRFLMTSTQSALIRKPKGEDQPVEEGHVHLHYARQNKAISTQAIRVSVQALVGAGCDYNYDMSMLAAIWQKKSVDPQIISELLNGLQGMTDYDLFAARLLSVPREAVNHFTIQTGDDMASVVKHMQLQAAEHLLNTFENKTDVVKAAMSFSSPIVPCLLAGLRCDSKKIRKKILVGFEVAMKKPVARANYAPLVKALVANKPALVATADNLVEVMVAFAEETRSTQATMHAILGEAVKSDELLAKIAPILGCLDKTGIVELAMYATVLMAKLDDGNKRTFEAILDSVIIPKMVENMSDGNVWEFLSTGMRSPLALSIQYNGLNKSPACALIDVLSDCFDKSDYESSDRLKELFASLIELSSIENIAPEHLASARGLILTLLTRLDASIFGELLRNIWGEAFFSVKGSIKAKRATTATQSEDDDSKWLKTTFLLEVSQKKFVETRDLLQPLAVLLKTALHEQDHRDHAYVLDLLISTLLNIVDSLTASEKESNPLDPELIVQCIRNCKNPNTKATALLLLAKSTAATNAEYILHNSIQLFTFVGTHFLQVESKTSFDIACTAIDILVPHILSVCKTSKGEQKAHEISVSILNTFVDASSDMPRHRFCVFMHRLASRMGADTYLWLMTLLLIKGDARKKQYDSSLGGPRSARMTMEERQQQLRDLYAMFDGPEASVQVSSLLLMVQRTNHNTKDMRKLLGISENSKTAKLSANDQFDMVRVKMLSFAQSLLMSHTFMRQVVQGLQRDDLQLRGRLQALLEATVMCIEALHEPEEDVNMEDESRIRRQLALCCEKVFEATLAVIPTSVFVQMLANLLAPKQTANIKRKALEVFNARLVRHDGDSNLLDDPNLPSLMEPLSDLALDNKGGHNQQLALLCIRSLAKALQACPSLMVQNLKTLCSKLATKDFLNSLDVGAVIAATLLCLTELFNILGPHAVVHVKPFIVWVLALMSRKDEKILNPVVLNSLVVAVQKCIDNFGGFLNPYYRKLVIAACQLTAWHHDQQSDGQTEELRHGASRIKQLQLAMSRGIPTHSLMSISKSCYDELGELDNNAQHIIALSNIIKENVIDMDKAEVMATSSTYLDFFLHAFKYRQGSSNLDLAEIVEAALGDAFLSFALKLSLEDFKPLYYRLFNLALDVDNKEGIATVFHITTQVAMKLKSLFSFVCEMIVQKATGILQEYAKRKDTDPEASRVCMLGYIMDALTSIFQFNRVDSLLMKSYEDHVNAILEHLDVPHGESPVLLAKIKNCLGQLASTTEDETQWKYLNYQVLLLIRSKSPKVRMTILEIIDLFVQKRGENYLVVLPDSVHFLVEALEDDDQQVENRCRALIKKMEEVFGQSIESYFE